jgi:hypothetical protein
MDYSLIMIRMDQNLKLYQKSLLAHDVAQAKTYAAVLVELAENLLSVTRGMK